jgi:hypothetical protein
MKFFTLIIMPDLSLQRSYVDNDMVLAIMKKNPTCKIYRNTNDQVAVLVEDQIYWQDIKQVDVDVKSLNEKG